MRFDRLDLIAYGRFSNRSFGLAAERPFDVVYGDNGDGKTTALRAVSDLLFGIPERTRDAYLFAPNLLKVGGVLAYGAGETLEFVRRKGRKNTLSEPDSVPLPDGVLEEILHGVDRELFESMFALSHDRLVAGAQALLRSGGELREALFGAGVGTAALPQFVRGLEDNADLIFKPQASKPSLNAELHTLEQAHREVSTHSLSTRARRIAEAELEEMRAAIAELGEELTLARVDQARLERVERVLPHVAQRQAKLEALAMLADAAVLPADTRERRLRALDAKAASEETIAAARAAEASIADDLERIERAPHLLARGEEVTQLHAGVGKYLKDGADLPRVQADYDAANRDARSLLATIDSSAKIADAETLRPAAGLRAQIQKAAAALLRSEERVDAGQERRDEASGALVRAKASLPPDPALLPLDHAQAVLSAARQHGDLEAQTKQARASAVRLEQKARTALGGLPAWQGTLETLALLAVPTQETIARFDQQITEAQTEIRELAAERTRAEDQLRQIDEDLNALAAGLLPTEEDITAARARRDEGWRHVHGVWLDGADAGLADSFTQGLPLDQAFEQSVTRADEIVDMARSEAQSVAQRDNLARQRERLVTQLQVIADRSARAVEELEQVQAEWRAQWPTSVLEQVLPPAEMRSWLLKRQQVLERADEGRRAADEHERLRSLSVNQKAAILAAIRSVGADGFGEETPLAALGLGLEQALERELEQRRQSALAKDKLAELEAAEQTAQRTLAAAEESLRSAAEKWRQAAAATGAPASASPAAVEEILGTLEQLFQHLDLAAGYSRRVEGMRRDRERFEEDTQALVEEVAPDLAELPPEQAVRTLVRRQTDADRKEVRAAELAERLAEQKRIRVEAQATLERWEAELDLLRQTAGCAALDELEDAEQRSAARIELEQRVRQLEESIVLGGVGVLDELVAAAEAADADELAALVRRAADKVAGLEARHTELVAEVARRELELDLNAGGAEAAAAAERAENARATCERLVESFVESRLAAVLLRRAIERYREENQGPVLARARELFPRLTLGKFTDLAIASAGDDELVLVGRRDGEDVPVESLSDGERDALYLALRIASLEHHFRSNEPMPVLADDLLVSLDERRVTAALETLSELTEQTQVILFTHHQFVVELAKQVVPATKLALHDLGINAASGLAQQAAA